MKKLLVYTPGLIHYQRAWELQKKWVQERIESPERPDAIMLCQHPPTITYGRRINPDHLKMGPEELSKKEINLFNIERGGDITFHGPGQLVGYPILRIKNTALSVHGYIRMLEEMIIKTLKTFAIQAARTQGKTGVWVHSQKIASIGIALKRWITYHGFALNINTDLSGFDSIVPCGIQDCTMTSMQAVCDKSMDFEKILHAVLGQFCDELNYTDISNPVC